jgi:hypothetical protein
VPHVNRSAEIQLSHEFGKVVGVGVHIVAGPRLAGTAVAATVVGDAPVSVLRQKEHLVFKGVRVERPAVTEDDRLTGSPVLVIDLGAVFGRESTHNVNSSVKL